MVALPGQLFYSTQIPACLWFLARNRKGGKLRDRRGEELFIDARKLGRMVDRTHRELTYKDITRIADTYHAWRSGEDAGEYVIIHLTQLPGACSVFRCGGEQYSGSFDGLTSFFRVHWACGSPRRRVPMVEVDPKYTSQDCHRCGARNRPGRSERYACVACGLRMDRGTRTEP